MQKKIKIAFLIDSLRPGGTENQLIWLSDNLPRNLFNPVILTIEENNLHNAFKVRTPIICLKDNSTLFLDKFKILKNVVSYLHKNSIDILQTHFLLSELYGTVASFFCHNLKLVITRRNNYHDFNDHFYKYKLSNILLNKKSTVLSNSHFVKTECIKREKVSKNQIKVIHNSVDINSFLHLDSAKAKKISGIDYEYPIIGVVANWRPIKGLKCFLKAAHIASKQLPYSKFVLVGHGPQENELKNLSNELNLNDRVIFIRNPKNIPAHIISFDIAVQPSLSESFSNSLIEYMAAGKPIVATNVGEADIVIKDGLEGIVIQPNNHLQMSAAILKLCNNKNYALNLGLNAQNKVKLNWNPKFILEKYIQFYKNFKRH